MNPLVGTCPMTCLESTHMNQNDRKSWKLLHNLFSKDKYAKSIILYYPIHLSGSIVVAIIYYLPA